MHAAYVQTLHSVHTLSCLHSRTGRRDGRTLCLNLLWTDVHWGLLRLVLGTQAQTKHSLTVSCLTMFFLVHHCPPFFEAPEECLVMEGTRTSEGPRAQHNEQYRKLRRHGRPFVISNNGSCPDHSDQCSLFCSMNYLLLSLSSTQERFFFFLYTTVGRKNYFGAKQIFSSICSIVKKK